MDADQRRGIDRRLRARTFSETTRVAARIRLGFAADVLNLSADGALLESAQRLRPGTAIDIQLETPSYRAQVRARVVHARVSELAADRVRYRGGVAFERALDGLTASIEPPPTHEWEDLMEDSTSEPTLS